MDLLTLTPYCTPLLVCALSSHQFNDLPYGDPEVVEGEAHSNSDKYMLLCQCQRCISAGNINAGGVTYLSTTVFIELSCLSHLGK